jgi:hypothetical protein
MITNDYGIPKPVLLHDVLPYMTQLWYDSKFVQDRLCLYIFDTRHRVYLFYEGSFI